MAEQLIKHQIDYILKDLGTKQSFRVVRDASGHTDFHTTNVMWPRVSQTTSSGLEQITNGIRHLSDLCTLAKALPEMDGHKACHHLRWMDTRKRKYNVPLV